MFLESYIFFGTAFAAFVLGHNAGRGDEADATAWIALALVWMFWPLWLLGQLGGMARKKLK